MGGGGGNLLSSLTHLEELEGEVLFSGRRLVSMGVALEASTTAK